VAAVVAEYLGVDVQGTAFIDPVSYSGTATPACPFRNGPCDKVVNGLKPICSVRDGSGELWISCRHRLCATSPKDQPLTRYQIDVLLQISRILFGSHLVESDIAERREVPVRTEGRSPSYADYVIIPKTSVTSGHFVRQNSGPVVLEMQGGGETSNTGSLTAQVDAWEKSASPRVSMSILKTTVPNVNTIEANAWRRQQEQFLYKGNVAVNSHGRLAFVVGTKLFDYLVKNIGIDTMLDLRNGNWTLAIIGVSEDHAMSPSSWGTGSSVRLQVDPSRLLFTSYARFVQAIVNQGAVDSSLFFGEFVLLDGTKVVIG
jgi:hypothetical protein